MKQLDLFDAPPEPIADAVEPCDPSVTAVEKHRLSRQSLEILALLRERDATNDELSKISRKYTSRISDLRKAGYPVVCLWLDRKTGLSMYHLATPEDER